MKTVAITGVGRATAHAFARHGANVALIARDPRALHDTACEVRRTGAEAGLGASRAMACGAVFAMRVAAFAAARKPDR
ncbi:hypothetical protein DIE21_10820 [Burkholderia sp. Bp9140]|nr:hypothetical protein DIE21_10820 [Burkholderia sp. Bp9140]